jgi:hypothetical protein
MNKTPYLRTTLWEGDPVTITVDPASMVLSAYDDEKVRKIREDYKDVKVFSATHIHKEWKRRWAEAKLVEVEDFDGRVEILTNDGTILGRFSGSDEYSGQVNNVWKITLKTTHKRQYSERTWQLWTSYNLIES